MEIATESLEELAATARTFHLQLTGRSPKSVNVALSEEMLVVTLHDALTPAEIALAQSPAGADQVQEFHRQLFAACDQQFHGEIKRLTGRNVRDASVDIAPSAGGIVHAFTTGTMLQVFLLAPGDPSPDAAVGGANTLTGSLQAGAAGRSNTGG